MRAGLVASLVALTACTDVPTTPSTKPTTPSPTKAAPRPGTTPEPEPVAKAASPFVCAADTDCFNSCTHGAVNGMWHRNHYPGGEACEDGCTRKGTDPARCEDGKCVAYHQGARSDVCTQVDTVVIPGPGPAHRCQSDGDCTQTCALGAVNAQWLSWQTDPPLCNDGCTAQGTESPRCEEGLCVAYHLGKRNDHCTAKPIPRP